MTRKLSVSNYCYLETVTPALINADKELIAPEELDIGAVVLTIFKVSVIGTQGGTYPVFLQCFGEDELLESTLRLELEGTVAGAEQNVMFSMSTDNCPAMVTCEHITMMLMRDS